MNAQQSQIDVPKRYHTCTHGVLGDSSCAPSFWSESGANQSKELRLMMEAPHSKQSCVAAEVHEYDHVSIMCVPIALSDMGMALQCDLNISLLGPQ